MFIEIASNKEELRDIINYAAFDYEGEFIRPCLSDEHSKRFCEVANHINYPIALEYTESLDSHCVGEWRIIDLHIGLYDVIRFWEEKKKEAEKMEEKYREILEEILCGDLRLE